MMMRDKVIRCVCPALLIVLSVLLGSACKVEAELILPKSIVEILGETMIEELKAKEEVKAIKIAKRVEIRTKKANAVYWNPAAQIDAQKVLRQKVNDTIGLAGIGKILTSRIDDQKISFSDPNNPNGLAVKFAPSDEELGIK